MKSKTNMVSKEEKKMNSKEIVSRRIRTLGADLQQYTMIEKDEVQARFIAFQLEEYRIIQQDLDRLEQLEKQLNDGTLSDGYHTFNDLYYQRLILFATIVNQNKELAWKSLKHEDGEPCFGGDWFIVGIDTPKGSYTYHYEANYWSLFNCKELEVAKHWDGHTSKDVDRLLSLENSFEKENQELKEAIKILKAKLVPILLLQEVDTPEEYNEGLDDCDEYRLTQKEFDLLKQVFESVGDSDE